MKKLILTMVIVLFAATVWGADPVSMTERQGITKGYWYTETIATTETGKNVKIAPMGLDGTNITCTIYAGANTGHIEFSTSSDAAILADTAVWQSWPLGVVTGTNSDALTSQVSGLRAVSDLGEISYEIIY